MRVQWSLQYKTTLSGSVSHRIGLKLEVVLKWGDTCLCIGIENIRLISLISVKWRELLYGGVLDCRDHCVCSSTLSHSTVSAS